MNNVIKIFKLLQSTSGSNDKKKIIEDNKDNELFKKCLVFLLDSNVVTGISSKKINKKVQPSSELSPYYLSKFSTFEKVMDYLKTHNTGRDDDIYEIQCFLDGNEDEREFYEQMITKTFKLGCDSKTVNKVIPNLIPTFDVMLGTSIEHAKIKEDTWFSLSQKLNGNRCVFYDGKLYTRQGKVYNGLEHIIEDIKEIPFFNTFVFDGELIYKNEDGALTDSEAFQKGTGIAQSKDVDKSCLKLVIFDIITKEDFENKTSKLTYKDRKPLLIDLRDNFIKKLDLVNLDVVKFFYEGKDQTEIWKWLDYAEENDMEGLMLSLDEPYECKRTKTLLKVKKFYEFDLRIVGVEEGTGRNKGKLGSFVVEYKNNTVNVGSGYSDEERKLFWENKDDYIGRVITVKYKEISTDKNTKLESLQFPIYCGMREIGKEPSYE